VSSIKDRQRAAARARLEKEMAERAQAARKRRQRQAVIGSALAEATGKILREAVYADRDFPPFHRATMDGIALAFAQVEAGRRTFRVAGTVYAGTPPVRLADPEGCVEIMTGAVLPEGADTVVRYEDLQLDEGPGGRRAMLRGTPEKPGHNVHRRGTDGRQGDLLIPAGTRLGPAEIGVAASVGRVTLTASGPLRGAVGSTTTTGS